MKVLKKSIISLLMATAMFVSALSVEFAFSNSIITQAEQVTRIEAPWLADFVVGINKEGLIGSSTKEFGINCTGIIDYVAKNNITDLIVTEESEKQNFYIGVSFSGGTMSGPPLYRYSGTFTWKSSSFRLVPGETVTYFIKSYYSPIEYYYSTTVYSEYDKGTLTIDLSEGSYDLIDAIERYTFNHAIQVNSLLNKKYDSNIMYINLDNDEDAYDLKATIIGDSTGSSVLLEKTPECSISDEITITTPTDKMSLDQFYYGSVKFIFGKTETPDPDPIPDPIDDNKDKPAQTQPVVNEEAPAAQNTAPAEVFNKSLKTTKFEKITATKKSVTLTWKKQAKKTSGYQIEYSTNKNFKDSKLVTINKAKTTSKTIGKLKSGKKYYFRIRTIKKTASGISYSKWSSKKSIKTSKK